MSGLKLKWKKDGLGVKWDKTEGASKYEVYATYCGKKCTVYVYAVSGIAKKVSVTVK